MSTTTKLDLVGLHEIADRLGITYQAVRLRRSRGYLPDPDWVVSGSPVWSVETMEEWETEKAESMSAIDTKSRFSRQQSS